MGQTEKNVKGLQGVAKVGLGGFHNRKMLDAKNTITTDWLALSYKKAKKYEHR